MNNKIEKHLAELDALASEDKISVQENAFKKMVPRRYKLAVPLSKIGNWVPNSNLTPLTMSKILSFWKCPKSYQLRYEECLAPKAPPEYLYFGTAFHRALEMHYKGKELSLIIDWIKTHTDTRESITLQGMLIGYLKKYQSESIKPIATEKEFMGPLKNPLTGRSSRLFYLAGKIDLIYDSADHHGSKWIMDHKTTQTLNQNYTDSLWADIQNTIYVIAAREFLGIPVWGSIQNVIVKAQIKQGQKETEDEFLARMVTKYENPELMTHGLFHRIPILMEKPQVELAKREIWNVAHKIRECQRCGEYGRQTSNCHTPGRSCKFYRICSTFENPEVIRKEFVYKPPTEELSNGKNNDNNA